MKCTNQNIDLNELFINFITFLDAHSGSLTFLVTVVYVIATIAICWANISSANASKAQLEEMQKQYKEENRPNIEVEFIFVRRSFVGLRFINHGKVTAQNVQIFLDSAFLDKVPYSPMKDLLLEIKNKQCVIGVGQHYDLFIGTSRQLLGTPDLIAFGKIEYRGNNQTYYSDFSIDLTNYSTMFSTQNEMDDICKKFDEQNRELKNIRTLLQREQDKEHYHV